MRTYDIVIAGGGILGCSISYWLSELYNTRIAVLEKNEIGSGASSRNTGVLHRPFYLDPSRRKKFAIAANLGYRMWGKIAQEAGLPWVQEGRPSGTLELATSPEQVATLEKYVEWGIRNGMEEKELDLLRTRKQVKGIEPFVECFGALLCRTDTAVDFGAFTRYMGNLAWKNGVHFSTLHEAVDIEKKNDRIDIYLKSDSEPLSTTVLINCAGGSAVDIAHKCGLGLEYTDLHFRGDFWRVDPSFGNHFMHNIYTVPDHPKFQFLDPHLIIRADERYEIGPSAVPVAGPENYDGIGWLGLPRKLMERPIGNKLRLLTNPEFLRLAFNELTHLSKEGMVKRMKHFIPLLEQHHITDKGDSGIRHSLIAPDGSFVPEAVEVSDGHSYHVLNYNSPGASGSIAYAAYVVNDLMRLGLTGNFRRIPQRSKLFEFDEVVSNFK